MFIAFQVVDTIYEKHYSFLTFSSSETEALNNVRTLDEREELIYKLQGVNMKICLLYS